mmetsp:Transcript_36209/g.47904  ORF Transcript_36209/g.47904 Transcript_36209/m.47904 type:complete len:215 (-) Transcript_36209:14-658(-)
MRLMPGGSFCVLVTIPCLILISVKASPTEPSQESSTKVRLGALLRPSGPFPILVFGMLGTPMTPFSPPLLTELAGSNALMRAYRGILAGRGLLRLRSLTSASSRRIWRATLCCPLSNACRTNTLFVYEVFRRTVIFCACDSDRWDGGIPATTKSAIPERIVAACATFAGSPDVISFVTSCCSSAVMPSSNPWKRDKSTGNSSILSFVVPAKLLA